MLTTKLRSVGGSVMLAIPKPILQGLGLVVNESVSLRMDNGELVVSAQKRPVFSLAELLSQCTAEGDMPHADVEEWDSTPPVGREVI